MHLTYNRLNLFFGFLILLIASTVYCLTVEPTASLWDCPEFIIAGYKLEVGHPPGAPFFMLTANVFTQLTGDPALAAKMVNYMSAITSALTILFLFLSITHLTKKLLVKGNDQPDVIQMITIFASGIVGALVYTFSDTFWFSAVEGEVYAYSSLFTAVVFWLILKWEDNADQPHSDRWLILIAYFIGLSIGVHLLNLLCIPAIVLVYFFKRYPDAKWKGTFLALVLSGLLIVIILYGIVPGLLKVGGWFELFFVNTVGLSFNTGLIIYMILVFSVLCWGIYESYVGKSDGRIKFSLLIGIGLLGIPFYGYGIMSFLVGAVILFVFAFYLFSKKIGRKYSLSIPSINTILISLLMIVIGYSSYALILVRSSANTPMDQNSPEDVFRLSFFLNREGYGDRPLFHGQAYSSERNLKIEGNYCMYDYKDGPPQYIRKPKEFSDEKDEYIISHYKFTPVYAQTMLFPRMYSTDHASYGTSKVNLYKQWVDIKGKDVSYNRCGEQVTVNIPTQWENIQFFFNYQLNYMYWRYFLWNFVGRQSDVQGHGELEKGNWITGIPFIDRLLIGNQEFMPDELRNNKGRNVYFCLPLLLGILGLIWQLSLGWKGKQSFMVVLLLFFMTGIAIVIYLNQTPMQARERDYAYAGSFYAFAIWIGMGVAAIIQYLKRKGIYSKAYSFIISAVCLLVPIQMVTQTWDDHDRSGRYSCRDIGQNYLMSASSTNNPIIYTSGDNDTFPLWYNQEVEGFRTDARICNIQYLQTDWYIDAMRRPAYDCPALPIPWKESQYQTGTREAIPVRPEMRKQIDELYKLDPEKAKAEFGENPYELQNILKYWVLTENEQMRMIPTDSLVFKIDKEAVIRSGMKIPDSLNGEIPEYMHLSLKGKTMLLKNETMMLQLLAECNWERPIYMAISVAPESHFCFNENFCQEGLLYRFTPFNTLELDSRFDTEKTYKVLMNDFKWGGVENPGFYMDENTDRFYASQRRLFGTLALQLIKEGKTEKALKALNYCIKVIPDYSLPYDFYNGAEDLAKAYYRLGEFQNGDKIMVDLIEKSLQYLNWYVHMDNRFFRRSMDNCTLHFYLLHQYLGELEQSNKDLFQHYIERLEDIYAKVHARSGGSM